MFYKVNDTQLINLDHVDFIQAGERNVNPANVMDRQIKPCLVFYNGPDHIAKFFDTKEERDQEFERLSILVCDKK